MNTTGIGKEAEDAAAAHLTKQGYEILARNWRRRVCEIDIVAKKNKVVYFVEVKYRTSEAQGSGLEYITPQKTRQLKFAAQQWIAESEWEGDYRILAASVASDRLVPIIEQVVEI
ncbi:MAG: Ribonuclease [Candidatus Saccharibacteria bacterium]|nr:Ribonuclease [Candidatus Saccharibacteria bacterium]